VDAALRIYVEKKLLINDKLNSNAGRSMSKAGVGREYLGVLIGG
jgi:hypothetical protein